MDAATPQGPLVLGRYALFDELASGGMATVHYGRLRGDAGFARTVVVKRLHAHYAKDPELSGMFLDEARLAARIRHPNVVQTLDVVQTEGELFLVMELVVGEALHHIVRDLVKDAESIPLEITSAIVCSILHGLHAAHEATSETGAPLSIVHRDVSPSNVLVGADGIIRLIDFGVAKAANRVRTTRDGSVKGKVSYMSPEQLYAEKLDRRSDIFASGVVLWELLTMQRLFQADSDAATLMRIMELDVAVPSATDPLVPKALDQIVLRALQREPSKRYATAKAMAQAIEAVVPVASSTRVASWLEEVAGDAVSIRTRTLARIEGNPAAWSSAPVVPAGLGAEPHVEGHPSERRVEARSVEPEGTNSTVSTTIVMPSPARRQLVRWGSYAAVAIAAGTIGVVASRWRPAPARPEPAASTSATAVDIPPPPSATAAASSAPSPPVDVPVVSASAPPPPKPVAHPPKPHHPTTPKPCTTSYVDENGIKQYRNCP